MTADDVQLHLMFLLVHVRTTCFQIIIIVSLQMTPHVCASTNYVICHFDYLPLKIPQIHFIQSSSELTGYVSACPLKETCCCWLSRSWMCDLLYISWNSDESIVLLVSYRLHLTFDSKCKTCHHCVLHSSSGGWKPLSLQGCAAWTDRVLSRFSHFFLFLTWWLCRRSCLSWLCLCLCVWMMYELLLSMIRWDPPLQWLTPVQAQSSPWCLWIHVVLLCLCLCFLYLCFS